MINPLLSLVPPLLVFITAFATKRVLLALTTGICSGALILTHGHPLEALATILYYFKLQITDIDNLMIFGFLGTLGALVALISHSGGALAYGNIIKRKIHDSRSAQLWSLGLSACFFFDDFFSSITTGCIMRPLTDHFAIPRTKLAFLIDSMAAPIAILVPFSSWIAMLMMQLEKAGIGKGSSSSTIIIGEPFMIYLQTIPFIFYSFILISSTLFIVYNSLSFGTLRLHEKIARSTGNLFGGKESLHSQIIVAQEGDLYDFFVPLIFLISGSVLSLLFLGGYHLLGGNNSLYAAFIGAPIFTSLALGSTIALGLSIIFFSYRKHLALDTARYMWIEGVKPMGHVMMILVGAWIFAAVVTNLHSGDAIANLFFKNSPIVFLPPFCFCLAAFTSIFIGSSWGTIALITPLVVPILLDLTQVTAPTIPATLPLLFPVLGATFAGAVAGDHISPLSSTTIMSSTSSGSYHFDHVRTQFEYVLPVLVATTLAYALCGLFASWYGPWTGLFISLPLGIVLSCVFLYFLDKRQTS